jgi:type VI secretion system protein ImpA
MTDLPDGFDLEALLAPIPGDAPQGVDIREDSSGDSPRNRLRDARFAARDAERGKEADDTDARDPRPLWRSVREIALKTLAETTKDLEVAAWLTEALLRSDGLAGLAAGAQLMAGLAERYWDGLFPLPDDYGMETRVAPVTGLNGRDGNGSLIQPLYKLTLFHRSDGTPVAYYQFKQSEPLDTLDAKQRIEFAALLSDARAAHDAWQTMAAVMDAKAGADGPSTTAVRDRLTEIMDIAARYAPAEATGDDPATKPGEAAGGRTEDAAAADNVGFAGVVGARGQAASREGALRALSEIANFFRRTEPHSPLSYTLDEAVRRGRMTWPELLAEVVADMDARNSILTTLGIRPPPPDAQE